MTVDVKVGDRIKIVETVQGEVLDIRYFTPDLHSVVIDVGNRRAIRSLREMEGREIEVLKHRKAEPGTVITGRQLKNTWWKRGTVIFSLEENLAHTLNRDGKWINGHYPGGITFDGFVDDEKFEVLVVPQ